MRLAAVVVTWNGEPWIAACLDSLVGQDRCPDLVVVDNGSKDGTVEIVEGFRHRFETAGATLTVDRLESNTGFPAGANRGLDHVLRGADAIDAVLLLNQDAALEPGCLQAFVSVLRDRPRAGCLGAKTLYPETRLIQHAGGFLEKPRMEGLHHGHREADTDGRHDEIREVEFVTGAAMLLRRTAITEVGFFNEVFSPGYYEDVELCDRLRDHEWQVVFTPAARVLHHESSSFADQLERLRLSHRNRIVYLLPRLADPEYEARFTAAETEFLEQRATFEEARAVSGAALDVMVAIPDIIRRRLGESQISPQLSDAANRVLAVLRTTCRVVLIRS